MAYILDLKSFTDTRGRLTSIDNVLPFEIKRLYYIDRISFESERGGHLHYETIEAVFCVNGSFTVIINNGKEKKEYFLNDPSKCLIVEKLDWHKIRDFSAGAILMGVSSTHYDHSDYDPKEPQIIP